MSRPLFVEISLINLLPSGSVCAAATKSYTNVYVHTYVQLHLQCVFVPHLQLHAHLADYAHILEAF